MVGIFKIHITKNDFVIIKFIIIFFSMLIFLLHNNIL